MNQANQNSKFKSFNLFLKLQKRSKFNAFNLVNSSRRSMDVFKEKFINYMEDSYVDIFEGVPNNLINDEPQDFNPITIQFYLESLRKTLQTDESLQTDEYPIACQNILQYGKKYPKSTVKFLIASQAISSIEKLAQTIPQNTMLYSPLPLELLVFIATYSPLDSLSTIFSNDFINFVIEALEHGEEDLDLGITVNVLVCSALRFITILLSRSKEFVSHFLNLSQLMSLWNIASRAAELINSGITILETNPVVSKDSIYSIASENSKSFSFEQEEEKIRKEEQERIIKEQPPLIAPLQSFYNPISIPTPEEIGFIPLDPKPRICSNEYSSETMIPSDHSSFFHSLQSSSIYTILSPNNSKFSENSNTSENSKPKTKKSKKKGQKPYPFKKPKIPKCPPVLPDTSLRLPPKIQALAAKGDWDYQESLMLKKQEKEINEEIQRRRLRAILTFNSQAIFLHDSLSSIYSILFNFPEIWEQLGETFINMLESIFFLRADKIPYSIILNIFLNGLQTSANELIVKSLQNPQTIQTLYFLLKLDDEDIGLPALQLSFEILQNQPELFSSSSYDFLRSLQNHLIPRNTKKGIQLVSTALQCISLISQDPSGVELIFSEGVHYQIARLISQASFDIEEAGIIALSQIMRLMSSYDVKNFIEEYSIISEVIQMLDCEISAIPALEILNVIVESLGEIDPDGISMNKIRELLDYEQLQQFQTGDDVNIASFAKTLLANLSIE